MTMFDSPSAANIPSSELQASADWQPRVVEGGKPPSSKDSGAAMRNVVSVAPPHASEEEAEAKRVVQSYSDLILRLSYTYLKSFHDAEDLCQNILIKMLTKAPRFEDAEHEKAWVIRATSNACKDVLRSGARVRNVRLEAASDESVEMPEDSEVLDAVSALPEAQRESVFLHYYEGYSIAEVARLTGRTEAAVAKQLSRARFALRRMLKG